MDIVVAAAVFTVSTDPIFLSSFILFLFLALFLVILCDHYPGRVGTRPRGLPVGREFGAGSPVGQHQRHAHCDDSAAGAKDSELVDGDGNLRCGHEGTSVHRKTYANMGVFEKVREEDMDGNQTALRSRRTEEASHARFPSMCITHLVHGPHSCMTPES